MLERASVGEERPRTVTENPIERDALRISLAKDMYDAARRAYGQQVGGSLEALAAFGEVIAAAVTAEVVKRAEAAALAAGAIEWAKCRGCQGPAPASGCDAERAHRIVDYLTRRGHDRS